MSAFEECLLDSIRSGFGELFGISSVFGGEKDQGECFLFRNFCLWVYESTKCTNAQNLGFESFENFHSDCIGCDLVSGLGDENVDVWFCVIPEALVFDVVGSEELSSSSLRPRESMRSPSSSSVLWIWVSHVELAVLDSVRSVGVPFDFGFTASE